jgi:Beta-propeller repeat
MRAIEISPHRPAQRYRGRVLRLAAAGLTIIALVIGQSLPITAMLPPHRAEAVASAPSQTLKAADAGRLAGDAFARLPLRFEARVNQATGLYLARTGNCNIYLTATEAALVWQTTAGAGRLGRGADLGSSRNAGSLDANEQLPGPRRDRAAPRRHRSTNDVSPATTLRMQLIGADPHTRMTGEDRPATSTNYFIGNDPKRWRANVPTYRRVKAKNVYRGIDAVYYGSGQELEYDFNVAPGANFRVIRLRFNGARSVRVDEAGDLAINTAAGLIRHRKPSVYQQVNGARKTVMARYRIDRRGDVRFHIGDYDKRLPLVIDPVLSYATYFGSRSGLDTITAVATDAAGNAYVAGSTSAADLPTTPGALQSISREEDGFIAKFNAEGTDLVYATYLGGSSFDTINGLAVDAAGNAYVTGGSSSTDFPTTAHAFQATAPGNSSHAFVAKLNPLGTALVYSTYLANAQGDIIGARIAIGEAGEATVAGRTNTPRFPVTANAVQTVFGGFFDAFIARFNANGRALIFATYLGGDGVEDIGGLALDGDGNVYVAGQTSSTGFPTTRHAYQKGMGGFPGNYITKLNRAGDRLIYSTFFGKGPLTLTGIAADVYGNTYVTGFSSSAILETTPGALQPVSAGDRDAFVTKLDAKGTTLIYSTFIGGSDGDFSNGIAVDSVGQAYITGLTLSADFPLVRPLQARRRGAPLHKSTDGGNSWEEVAAPLRSIRSLVIDPQMTATLYASSFTGIIKSTDGGATWRTLTNDVTGSLVIDPTTPTTLYALSNLSLAKSTDAGLTWERIAVPASLLPNAGYSFTSLVIDPKAHDTLYIGSVLLISEPDPFVKQALATLPEAVLSKSTDGGASWTALDLKFLFESVVYLAIDPQITSTLYAETALHGLLKSTDGGASWFNPHTSGVFSVSRLLVDPTSSATLYAANGNGVVKSTDGGASWGQPTLQRIGVNLVIHPQTPSTLYASEFEGIYKTIDGGTSWRPVLQGAFAPLLVLDPQQPSVVYAAGSITSDIFAARLNETGTALSYSTYFGSSGPDSGVSIVADNHGNAYIVGTSGGTDFPTLPNAYQAQSTRSSMGVLLRITDLTPLRITGVTINGKKLFVSGAGFDQGAVIVINNTDLQTRNDMATPSLLLLSKRGGTQIAPGQAVTIRVRNADGRVSDAFNFRRGSE